MRLPLRQPMKQAWPELRSPTSVLHVRRCLHLTYAVLGGGNGSGHVGNESGDFFVRCTTCNAAKSVGVEGTVEAICSGRGNGGGLKLTPLLFIN